MFKSVFDVWNLFWRSFSSQKTWIDRLLKSSLLSPSPVSSFISLSKLTSIQTDLPMFWSFYLFAAKSSCMYYGMLEFSTHTSLQKNFLKNKSILKISLSVHCGGPSWLFLLVACEKRFEHSVSFELSWIVEIESWIACQCAHNERNCCKSPCMIRFVSKVEEYIKICWIFFLRLFRWRFLNEQ